MLVFLVQLMILVLLNTVPVNVVPEHVSLS